MAIFENFGPLAAKADELMLALNDIACELREDLHDDQRHTLTAGQRAGAVAAKGFGGIQSLFDEAKAIFQATEPIQPEE